MNLPVRPNELAFGASPAPERRAPSPAGLALVNLECLLESLKTAAAQAPAARPGGSVRVLACAPPPARAIVLPRPDAAGQTAAISKPRAAAKAGRRSSGSAAKAAFLVSTAAGAIVVAAFLLQEDDRPPPAPRLAYTAEAPDTSLPSASSVPIEGPSPHSEETPPAAELTGPVETAAPAAGVEPATEAAAEPPLVPVAVAPPDRAAAAVGSNEPPSSGATPVASGGAETDEASEPPLPPERPENLGRRARHAKSAKTPKAPQTEAGMSAAIADVEQPPASGQASGSSLLGALPLLRAIGVK